MPRVILLIEKSRAYGRGLLRGAIRYSNLHGPWLFFTEPEPYRDGPTPSHDWMASLRADGILAHTWDQRTIEMILDLRLPAVVCGLQQSSLKARPVVTCEQAVGRMAAEYLLDRGYQRFAYCGYDDMPWSQRRGQDFSRTVAGAGFETFFYRPAGVDRPPIPGQDQPAIAEWLRSLPRPIAVMASNDDRSQDVLAACRIAGIKVPLEVAILGVDNDEFICDLSYPQLSSIAIDTERAGYEAARVLHRMIRREPLTYEDQEVPIFPLRVVTRQSTDILAVEDVEVAAAVQFIRKHAREAIQVSDVAEAVGLSRRALQQRFRKVLARSVHEEIGQGRVNHMAEMLIRTNLPVFQIAELLGYPDASNISRYFKRQKGMSPSAYRKRLAPSVGPSPA